VRRTELGDDAWLSTQEVAGRLGIRPETVYAYVSRGLLSREHVGRRSRFRLSEVDALLARLDPGMARPVDGVGRMFRMVDGVPRYRDVPVVELAGRASFEEVVDLLWTASAEPGDDWHGPDATSVPVVRSILALLPEDMVLSERLKIAVATLGALDHAGSSFHPPEVMRSGRGLLVSMVTSLPRADGAAEEMPPEHRRGDLAALLWPRLTRVAASSARVSLLDAALVLSAEHGMAPSTMVARTAASLGATIHGVVASGLGAGTGDVMGSSALLVEDLVRSLRGSPMAIRGIVERARIQRGVPGFGHAVYPDGDVRARYLLARLAQTADDTRRLTEVSELVRVMRERGMPPPTLYFALASLSHCFDMAHGATEAMFFIGRSAGWIAHAIEEYRRK